MRIAIYLSPPKDEGLGHIQQQLLLRFIAMVAESRPQHQYALIGYASWEPAGNLPQLIIMSDTGSSSSWFAKWRQRNKQRKWLSQWQPDVLITNDSAFTLFNKLVPTVWLWHSDWQPLAPLFWNQDKRLVKSQPTTTGVMLAWKWQQQAWQKRQEEQYTRVLALGAGTLPCFKPATWAERTSAKTWIASGEEYFLYVGPVDNEAEIVAMLKAFSSFKKRQRSNMRLVIQCIERTPSESLQQKLDSYKYRSEITLQATMPNPEVLARMAAGSYGVLVPGQLATGWWLLGLLQCETAIICPHTPATTEVLGEAAIYIEAWEEALLWEALMHLYKEEAQRNSLLLAGNRQLVQYGWNNLSTNFWNALACCLPEAAPI